MPSWHDEAEQGGRTHAWCDTMMPKNGSLRRGYSLYNNLVRDIYSKLPLAQQPLEAWSECLHICKVAYPFCVGTRRHAHGDASTRGMSVCLPEVCLREKHM